MAYRVHRDHISSGNWISDHWGSCDHHMTMETSTRGTANVSNYGPAPVRGSEHELLNAFIGTWHAEGVSYGEGQDPKRPRAHGLPWISDETTIWHPGGFFVIQHEHAHVGSGTLITHAIIGYDTAASNHFAHAIENHGHYRHYRVRADGRVWTFTAELERARIEFSEDGVTQSVLWEWRPFDQEWLPLCERTNVRIR